MTDNITGEVLTVSEIHFAVESRSALLKMVEAAYFCPCVQDTGQFTIGSNNHRQADASVSSSITLVN